METANRMKERRMELGLTAAEVGRQLGIHRGSVLRYEKGLVEKIPNETVVKLAEILQTTADYLMGFTDNPQLSPFIKLKNIFNQLEDPQQTKVINYATKQLKQQKVIPLRPTYEVSLMSWKVSAGTGLMNFDDIETIPYLVETPPPVQYDYAWQVSGDSMEPLFQDGEIIYTKKIEAGQITDGQVIVTLIDDDLYVKKASLKTGQLVLQSLNKKYKDILVDEDSFVQIVGRVVF